jgi:hypothetical protein
VRCGDGRLTDGLEEPSWKQPPAAMGGLDHWKTAAAPLDQAWHPDVHRRLLSRPDPLPSCSLYPGDNGMGVVAAAISLFLLGHSFARKVRCRKVKN